VFLDSVFASAEADAVMEIQFPVAKTAA
jgi:hypothetical protein